MEITFPKLPSLWTVGNVGYDYIEAMTGVIIDNGDITALSRSHQLAYGLGAPSEDGYTQNRQKNTCAEKQNWRIKRVIKEIGA